MWEKLPFDRLQKNNYNYARGQFTTYWQIPDKYNNYNYVRGQLTTFWQIPDKKIITIMREGNTIWQIPGKKIITIMYYLLPIDRFQTKK